MYYLFLYNHLPVPFFYDKNDTFMDFYNTLYWTGHEGRYVIWKSVYPPLNFFILKIIDYFFVDDYCYLNSILLRECNGFLNILIIISCLSLPLVILYTKAWEDIIKKRFLLCYALIVTSTPFIFAIERGNFILICMAALPILLRKNIFIQSIALAILINLKPYFLIFFVAYLLKKRFFDLFVGILSTLLLFMVTSALVDMTSNSIFINLIEFPSERNLPLKELLALPASVDGISKALKTEEIYQLIPWLKEYARTTRIISLILDTLRYLSIGLMCALLVNYRDRFGFDFLILALTSVITNIGWGFGGYTLILYIGLIPTVLKISYHKIFLLILLFLSVSFDWLIFVVYHVVSQISSTPTVSAHTISQVELFGIMRPFFNLSLLWILISELISTDRKIHSSIKIN
jgi:hypothetical protein